MASASRPHRVYGLTLEFNDLSQFSACRQPAVFLCRCACRFVSRAPHLSRRALEHLGSIFGAKLVHQNGHEFAYESLNFSRGIGHPGRVSIAVSPGGPKSQFCDVRSASRRLATHALGPRNAISGQQDDRGDGSPEERHQSESDHDPTHRRQGITFVGSNDLHRIPAVTIRLRPLRSALQQTCDLLVFKDILVLSIGAYNPILPRLELVGAQSLYRGSHGRMSHPREPADTAVLLTRLCLDTARLGICDEVLTQWRVPTRWGATVSVSSHVYWRLQA